MDFGGPPVGTSVNPVGQGLQTLSDVMNFRRSQQALQTGALQQQGIAADVQQKQQQNQEMQQVHGLLQQVHQGGYRDKNGNLDSQKLATDLASIGPYAGQAASNIIGVGNDIVSNQKATQALTEETRGQIGNVISSLATNPATKARDVTDAVADWISDHANDPNAVRVGKGLLRATAAVQDGPQLRTALSNIAGELTGKPQSAPSSVDSGGSIQPGQTLGATGQFTPAGQPIPKTLPPQIVNQPITGAPAQVGGAQGTVPRPIGGPGQGSNGWQPYAGQGADVQHFQQETQAVRAAGNDAPTIRNINQQILRLADNAKTGPGTDIWQHAVGALGAPFGLSPTANYQELGKFLEKNAINNMQSMGGPPSDARLSAAAAANGSTSFSPEALKAVTKFNDATNTGLIQYREGLDHAVGMGQNVDYTKLPAFKAAWAKNFDVDVFRVENAIRDGDKSELVKIKSELGPEKLRALAQKRANLNALSEGQIPP